MSSVVSSHLDYTPIERIEEIYQTISQGHSSAITKSYEWRVHQLNQLARLLQDNESLIEEALALDLGRPRIESHVGELIGTRKEVIHALENLKKWIKPKRVPTELAWFLAKPRISHEPRGIVLIFGAWNYPVTLLLGPLVGAIAAGNSTILKPSENSPATSNLLSTLIPKYLDPHNICVVNGGPEQASTLLNFRFDLIFFTGSASIGKTVALKAAETLTPTTLELGGKCPAVVLDDANFTVAAKRIIWAKLMNAGQTCIAPDYVLVSEQSEPKLIDAMKKALQEFYPSNNRADKNSKPDNVTTPDSQFSKIINQKHFDRLMGYLSQTNGEIVDLDLDHVTQPKSADPNTLRIPITLIRNVKEDDVLMRDELFGPLIPIVTYNHDHEGIVQRLRQISQSSPLAVYAFSESEKQLEFVRRHTKSGQFVCNDLMIQFAISGLPFGGVGNSGMGSYRGHHSFVTFSYARPILNFPTWAECLLQSRYPPYTNFKYKFMSLLLGAKTVKGHSQPHPPALTDPVNFKSLLDPSASGFLGKVGTLKFGLLALILAYYFKSRRDSPDQNRLISLVNQIRDKLKQLLG